jgi:hypothetical protein
VLLDAGIDTAKKAISALIWFILSTAEIGTPQTYTDGVTFRYTLPGIFARFCSINRVKPAGGETSIFSLLAPSNVHRAAASMLYSIRLSFVIAMLHAATSDSRPLQSWLHSPKVLVQARTMLDLANAIRVSKLYVGQVVIGGAKALPSKSDPSLMLPDTFTISGPAGVLKITQVMIQRAVNRLVRYIEDSHVTRIEQYILLLTAFQHNSTLKRLVLDYDETIQLAEDRDKQKAALLRKNYGLESIAGISWVGNVGAI